MKKRSKFSLSHYHLTTMNMGYLYPISCLEVLPGDTFQHATSGLIRVTPLVAPVMHPCHVMIRHFYVPTRLIWSDFEQFITGGEDGLFIADHPTVNLLPESSASVPSGSVKWTTSGLFDHFGVPDPAPGPGFPLSILPIRAYNLIWNEWFRNQDTNDPIEISLDSGPDSTTPCDLLPQAWGKDYFTTSSPTPQRGPTITVPVTGGGSKPTTADVQFTFDGTTPLSLKKVSGTPSPVGLYTEIAGTTDREDVTMFTSDKAIAGDPKADGPFGLASNPGISGKVTMTSDTTFGSINIDDLREAFGLQRFAEHRALYGSRYTEYLRYLGIRASDARLQRPEYLGGTRQTIQFSEVLQTAEGSDPVGTMRGHGIAAMRTPRYRRFFEEHGYVISLASIMPISIYMQGLSRMWSRSSRELYWQSELEHIGEQEVYTRELYCTASSSVRNRIFGYQNRYDEYRAANSHVSGEFRKLLNYWHFAREFGGAPTLASDFVYGTPTNRPFAEQTQNEFYCMFNHSIQARRLMSKVGNPR